MTDNKWLSTHTFHYSQFSDLARLVTLMGPLPNADLTRVAVLLKAYLPAVVFMLLRKGSRIARFKTVAHAHLCKQVLGLGRVIFEFLPKLPHKQANQLYQFAYPTAREIL